MSRIKVGIFDPEICFSVKFEFRCYICMCDLRYAAYNAYNSI